MGAGRTSRSMSPKSIFDWVAAKTMLPGYFRENISVGALAMIDLNTSDSA